MSQYLQYLSSHVRWTAVVVRVCCLLGAVTCWVPRLIQAADQVQPSDRPYNILFIAVDDLRPSIGCYGDRMAITPNIDRLASRGVLFSRAYCQVAVCNPSRASLMTGLRPDKLGVWTLPIHFRESVPNAVTMPQWFRQFGYTAVSHGKIFHNPTPDPQSWSEPIRTLGPLPAVYTDEEQERVKSLEKELPSNDWRKNNLRGPATAAPDLDDHQMLDGARTDLAIQDLNRLAQASEPFFLAMGYIRPHLAWVAPKKYWDLHEPSLLPVVTSRRPTPNTPAYALSDSYEMTHYADLIDFPKPWDARVISRDQSEHLMHAYYACVSYVDAQIGRLLDALEQSPAFDNTIVVLWSDHGWKLGEFNGWGKMSNYEIDTRVPLIVAAPHLKTSGSTCDELVELVDLFPTLCDLAGIGIPDFVDGSSFVASLDDPTLKTLEPAFSQYYRKHDGAEYMGYAMRTDTHRFVEWREFATGEVTDRELYDHRRDPLESKNLVQVAAEDLLEELTQKLLQSHPRRELNMTPSVHSSPSSGRWKSDIEFHNKLKSSVSIYPISTSGKRGTAKKLASGERVKIEARLGGVYVVESDDGTLHEIHSPAFPARKIVLK